MKHVATITKALADKNRLRVLCALRHGELCICQVIELLDLAPSTVSKHLSILENAHLVSHRKIGRWAYYSLADSEHATPQAKEATEWVLRSLSVEKSIRSDDQKLQSITNITPEELCQLQAQGIKCCSSAQETPVEAKWPKDGRECCPEK